LKDVIALQLGLIACKFKAFFSISDYNPRYNNTY